MAQAPSVPGAGPWVERCLSPARYGVYLAKTGGDRVRALELYQWNSALTCAVLHDFGHFEVAPRDAYAAALNTTWSGMPPAAGSVNTWPGNGLESALLGQTVAGGRPGRGRARGEEEAAMPRGSRTSRDGL